MADESRDELTENALRALFGTSALLDPLRLYLWDKEGLTVTQLRLLFHLAEQDGLSNAELSERMYVTRPSVSALLERLERGGFISREVDPDDRRGIRIRLEPRGREAVTTVASDIRAFGRRLIEDLSDQDLAEVAAALNKLIAAGRARRLHELLAEAKTAGTERPSL
ncbi:MAG: hypothetical protein Kow0010_19100 [Dehalococcoidia bacterium]